MNFAVTAHHRTDTNLALVQQGWRGGRSSLLSPREALLALGPGDVALNRLDVSADLAGIEDGNWIVNQLEAQGVRVFNRPSALVAAHDKVITARLLNAAGLPHPRTRRLQTPLEKHGLRYPVVAKPRYGSWGRDVELCADQRALQAYAVEMESKTWWRAGGVVQELVPPCGRDLRVIVSGGEVVGAAARIAAEGEWRTNVALGARSVPALLPADAKELALAAARVIGIDFGGIDLLPDGGAWVILEVNGAVDVRRHYSLGPDVFSAALGALQRTPLESALLA